MRKTIGHYEIVAELGRGGMGVVYKGFEPALHRHVAIKTLADHLAAEPTVVERFMREARSMAQLSDAHIVQIYMVGEDQGQPYFAMEFVEGESLADRLKREGRLNAIEARRLVLQAAQGLAVAHELGVIHRDIKPGNLLLTRRGVVKVADFGIALAASDVHQKLTGTGQFVGTPGYLSPEVCLGKPSDRRSDIFSLGIVLFEMLTGRMPFVDESPLGLMLSVVQSNIPDVRELASDVDEYTVQILEGMVAKDIGARYQSCEALVEALLAAGTPYHPTQSYSTPTSNRSATPTSNTSAATSVATPMPARAPTPATLPVPPHSPPASPVSAARTPAAMQQPASAASIAATAAMPAPPRPAAKKSNSRMLPVAIAALLLTGIALGGGYIWMNREASSGTTLTQTEPVASEPALPAATPPAIAADRSPAPTSSSALSSDASASPASAVPIASQEQPAAAAATAVPSPVAEPDPSAVSMANATPAPAEQPLVEPAPPPQLAATPTPAPVRTAASAPRAMGEKIAAAREGQAALRTARLTPPPERQPEPIARALPPRVLVVTRGDPAITGPAQAAIEEALEDAGVSIADIDLVAGLSRYADDDPAELISAIQRSGVASAVVVVNVVPIGQQELTYYGEISTLYTAQIRVRAFNVARREAIGRLAQAQVNFTSLNADFNTRQALEPMLQRMVSGVRQQLAAR